MKVTFKVHGLKEIDAELAKLGRVTAKKHLEAAFRVAAAPMVADIKANAPVDTGALRDSIQVTRMPGGSRDTANMQIGVLGEFYGHFHEFGTVKMAARPFVRPAWDRGAKGLIERFRDELARLVKKGASLLDSESAKIWSMIAKQKLPEPPAEDRSGFNRPAPLPQPKTSPSPSAGPLPDLLAQSKYRTKK